MHNKQTRYNKRGVAGVTLNILATKTEIWWWVILTFFAFDTLSPCGTMCIVSGGLANIGLGNILSTVQHQVIGIMTTNAHLLTIQYLVTNFSEILIKITSFFFKKMHLNIFVCEMVAILLRLQRVNTLRPRKMAAIFQTTFSNAFSSMKMYEFWLKFHWSLFLEVQLTIFHHWVR